jgi:hypothetical protein
MSLLSEEKPISLEGVTEDWLRALVDSRIDRIVHPRLSNPGAGSAAGRLPLPPAFSRGARFMLNKFFLGAAVSLAAVTALPSAAQADHRDRYDSRYYEGGYNDGRYHGDGYRRYRRGDYYRGGYSRGGSYNRGGYYNRGSYYGGGYGYNDRYYRGRRCGSGTTGAIVGGAAGALVGREIARDGRRYRRGGNGTVGAIVGGAVGALVGREIDRSC